MTLMALMISTSTPYLAKLAKLALDGSMQHCLNTIKPYGLNTLDESEEGTYTSFSAFRTYIYPNGTCISTSQRNNTNFFAYCTPMKIISFDFIIKINKNT